MTVFGLIGGLRGRRPSEDELIADGDASLGAKSEASLMDSNNGAIKTPMLVIEPTQPRLVSKDGSCVLKHIHIPHPIRNTYRQAVITNWFHLIIEDSWRFILLVFAGGFLLSWVFFGFLYYIIVLVSGELKHREENKQCIANVHSLVSAFLFSDKALTINSRIFYAVRMDSQVFSHNERPLRSNNESCFSLESQHTIGYGYRYMTEVCPPAFLVLCVQLIVGVLLQTMLGGIVVAKEIRFSQVAVIGPVDEHDRRPTLMIRIADIQKRLFLAESHVRLYMACSRLNQHGQRELIGLKDMNVGYDSGWDRVLLLWPIIVRHVIDEQSPLHGLTRDTLPHAEFELIMTVEGIVEATGMTFQARTSFLPSEIRWGCRFTPMVLLNEKIGQYEVEYSLFDETEHVNEFIPQIEDSDDEHSLHNASGFV
uniref:Inward rectifier potassium channel C-terminal domain-containing protein n=1 Tax=Ascaris lumbricoides TaxID=6252 RepID=A0A9J2PC33_ASCLU